MRIAAPESSFIIFATVHIIIIMLLVVSMVGETKVSHAKDFANFFEMQLLPYSETTL